MKGFVVQWRRPRPLTERWWFDSIRSRFFRRHHDGMYISVFPSRPAWDSPSRWDFQPSFDHSHLALKVLAKLQIVIKKEWLPRIYTPLIFITRTTTIRFALSHDLLRHWLIRLTYSNKYLFDVLLCLDTRNTLRLEKLSLKEITSSTATLFSSPVFVRILSLVSCIIAALTIPISSLVLISSWIWLTVIDSTAGDSKQHEQLEAFIRRSRYR